MSKKSSAAPSLPTVIEVGSETFASEVLDRSSTVPVVVDFWAPWCGPCQMLSPVLEKLAHESGGKFVLAKLNIDESPDVAGQFGVRSIPAVFAIKNGEAIDAFVGVQPESTIRQWIERIMPSEAESLAALALSLEKTDPKGAAEKYARALELQADLPEAEIGLARVALAEGQFDDAAARLATLERRGWLEPEAERLKAELTLRMQSKGAGSVDAARKALAAHPDDLKLKFALAEALASSRQYADALALCLELVERDRKGVGEQARQTMVAIFQLLPPGDELVMEYQRQLSMVL
ncbi:MAG: thioredoxin [Isosphaeraceae bacterium]